MKSWTLESQRIKSDSYPNSTLKIYDSRSKQVQSIDRENKAFQMYVCGITPYDSAHLGHAFTYLTFDSIIRTLNFIGISTNYVQNVTDIDDPLFERARKSGQPWQDIVNQQLDIYRKDMSALNILPPNHFVGVMENMGLITNQIGRTIDKNLSYKIGSEWYFETKSDKSSDLIRDISKNKLIELAKERGCDTDREGKKNQIDPILWKSSKDDEPIWNEEFGSGRPGWHIQCVSLAKEFAELPLDIQGGGKDLIFPHHAMSEEQTKALGLGELAKNYCHVGMVSYQGSKMSKSKGNLVFVHELIDQGVSPMVIRTLLMINQWNQDWEYDSSVLTKADDIYKQIVENLKGKYINQDDQHRVINLMLENLNTPRILDFLMELKPQEQSENVLLIDLFLDSLLGLKLESISK